VIPSHGRIGRPGLDNLPDQVAVNASSPYVGRLKQVDIIVTAPWQARCKAGSICLPQTRDTCHNCQSWDNCGQSMNSHCASSWLYIIVDYSRLYHGIRSFCLLLLLGPFCSSLLTSCSASWWLAVTESSKIRKRSISSFGGATGGSHQCDMLPAATNSHKVRVTLGPKMTCIHDVLRDDMTVLSHPLALMMLVSLLQYSRKWGCRTVRPSCEAMKIPNLLPRHCAWLDWRKDVAMDSWKWIN
jgi:hypothetical protein